ncbi:phage late control D family protein [Ilyobacter sp.]|uniref:phage late control D family protein n=1 Tax=Ilyobacter sp. TaxID=3100343 RepID=UPI00356909D9
MKARNSRVEIEYEGVNISEDVSPFLLGFTYNDNLNEFDDIEISFDDRDGNWHRDWKPKKGDRINATIILENWNGEEGVISLPCGEFEIDNPSFSGPPDVMVLKGISVPLSVSLMDAKKNRSWEKMSFKKIVEDIGKILDLKTVIESKWDGYFDRLEIKKESYWNFLKDVCSKDGISVKIFDKKIVVFDESEYEAGEGSFTIEKSVCKRYSFSDNDTDTYQKSRIVYTDPLIGQKIEKTFTAPERPRYREQTKRELVISERATVPGKTKLEKEINTERRAKKELRNKNKESLQGDFDIFTPSGFISAGQVGIISGFGMYDGKHIAVKVSHKIGGGYQVGLQTRECLEGY